MFSLAPPFNQFEITKYFNYKVRSKGACFSDNLSKKKMNQMSQISMTNTVKEHIGFHYSLFIDRYLAVYILLNLNIFRKKY